MRTILLAALMTLTASSQAAEKADTVVTESGSRVVVGEAGGHVTVEVFDRQGDELRKLRELTYSDGQEVEQINISSPFLIYRRGMRRQTFHSHVPSIYYGVSVPAGGALGFRGASGLHSKDTKSYDWGLTFINAALPLNPLHTFGISGSVQAGFVHHAFEKGYAMVNDGGRLTVAAIDDEGMKKSYISYKYVRIPIFLDWQQRFGSVTVFAGVGLSLDIRGFERSRYKGSDGTITPTSDLGMNSLGCNFEAHAGCGDVVLYVRSALTPLLNTDTGPKCYPTSIGIGLIL